jgi:hypothetical protein
MTVRCEPIHSLRQFQTLKGRLVDLLVGLKKEQGQLPKIHYSSLLFQQNFVKQPKSAARDEKIQLQREMTYYWLQSLLDATRTDVC